MRRTVFTIALAIGVVVAAWSIGRAQVVQPDFELIVEAPAGETTITCKRGCTLAWAERGIAASTTPEPKFTFKCSSGSTRCLSYSVGGWVTR